MTHTYQITGMTCSGCEAKVKSGLLTVPDITSVEVSASTNTGTISMSKHVSLSDLQKAISEKGNYKISVVDDHIDKVEQNKSWFTTYRPIFLIFIYIFSITLFIQVTHQQFDPMQWMRHFMAGFFIVFSFFKMLDLKAFAETYSMYDVIAKRIPVWGYLYAFLELGLGIAYLVDFYPLVTNIVTFVVMSVSIIGVLQSVLNKKKIQCACLGAVFNLPMSTVTIIEDALMILMAGVMIVQFI